MIDVRKSLRGGNGNVDINMGPLVDMVFLLLIFFVVTTSFVKETGIDVSDSGWDSEMIEYPFVLRHQGHLYMLYNGNGYGQSGFGLAILDER